MKAKKLFDDAKKTRSCTEPPPRDATAGLLPITNLLRREGYFGFHTGRSKGRRRLLRTVVPALQRRTEPQRAQRQTQGRSSGPLPIFAGFALFVQGATTHDRHAARNSRADKEVQLREVGGGRRAFGASA